MAPKETDDREGREASEHALKLLLKQFRELSEYFSYYVAAKSDSVKLSLRNIALWIGLAALGVVAVGGLIITASWLLLSGIAEGLGVLFGDRSWAGNVMTGLLLLAGLGLGTYFTVARWNKACRERTVEKYEERQTRQQAQFGRNISEQAAATPSEEK